MTYVTVPFMCKKCKLEYTTLLSAGGNTYCERCHMQTLYDKIEKLERQVRKK